MGTANTSEQRSDCIPGGVGKVNELATPPRSTTRPSNNLRTPPTYETKASANGLPSSTIIIEPPRCMLPTLYLTRSCGFDPFTIAQTARNQQRRRRSISISDLSGAPNTRQWPTHYTLPSNFLSTCRRVTVPTPDRTPSPELKHR